MRLLIGNVDGQRRINVSNYIEQEALLDALDKDDMLMSYKVRETIVNAPIVDVKPVAHGNGSPQGMTGGRII